MSQENPTLAEGINLSDATVLLPAQDLAVILNEVRDLKAELAAFKKTHNTFAVRTTNEIDEIFAKLDRRAVVPGERHAARLKKLDRCLSARKNEPLTFSEIGKLLELGSRTGGKNTRRQAMTKFSKSLDPARYEIFSANSQNGKMIKLAKEYYDRLRSEVVPV